MLVLKQQTFIESARSIGASDMTILLRHILPGTVSSIVVFFHHAHWHLDYLCRQPVISRPRCAAADTRVGEQCSMRHERIWLSRRMSLFFPALAIFLTVLAFNLLGDGLRDALDPKIKG